MVDEILFEEQQKKDERVFPPSLLLDYIGIFDSWGVFLLQNQVIDYVDYAEMEIEEDENKS